MPLPSNADQVVVQGFLFDEETGGGLQAAVTSEPVALTGQSAAPMVLDAVSHAHIQTRPRVTTPDPVTGYWALLALATNDPDLEAYGGRRITLPGQVARTIEVPWDAPQQVVSAGMAAQINPGNVDGRPKAGDTVRVLWFHSAAGYVAPTPASAYYDAAATRSLIADSIAAAGGGGSGTADLPEVDRTTAASDPTTLLAKTTRFSTTSAAVNQTLPPAQPGRQLAVGWDAGTNALTLTAAGSDVVGAGSATAVPFAVLGHLVTLHCTVAGRWRVTSGFTPQSGLDARYMPRPDETGAAAGDLLAAGQVNPLLGKFIKPKVVLAAGRPPLLVTLGDSLTAGSGAPNGPGMTYPTVLASLMDRRPSIVNRGVGGNTTAQMLARFDTDVAPIAPTHVLFLGGTNDLATGVATADTKANIAAIADKCAAIGAEFIICTLTPRNQWTAATSSVPHVRNLNAWIKLWARMRGYRCIDLNAACSNPRTGQWPTGWNVDAVHPSPTGIMAMAQAVANGLSSGGVLRGTPSLLPTDGSVDYLSGLGSTYAYDAQLVGNPLLYDTNGDRRPEGWRSTSCAAMTTGSSAGATTLQISDPLTPGAYLVSDGQAQAETVTITAVSGSSAPYTATLQAAAANPHPTAHTLMRAESKHTLIADPRFTGFAMRVACTAQAGTWTDSYRLPAGQWAVGDKLRHIQRLAMEGCTGIPTGSGVDLALSFVGPNTTVKAVSQWAADSPPGLAQVFSVDAVVPASTTAVDVQISIALGGGSATVLFGNVGATDLTTVGAADFALAA